MRVIIDTSVWSLVFRRQEKVTHPVVTEFEQLVRDGRIQMLGAIRQEILSGIRDRALFEDLRDTLRNFSDLNLDAEDYEHAAELFNLCRAKGIQGSNTDLLICAAARRWQMTIFTTDKDYGFFSRCFPFSLHEMGN